MNLPIIAAFTLAIALALVARQQILSHELRRPLGSSRGIAMKRQLILAALARFIAGVSP